MKPSALIVILPIFAAACGAPDARRPQGQHPDPDPQPLIGCPGVHIDPTDADRPTAFWNQKAVDEAAHLVSQERRTDLSLSIRSAREVDRAEATVVRTDWRFAQAVELDAAGAFAQPEISYSGSAIDVVLGDDHFSSAPNVQGVSRLRRSLIARWYHPGTWFESVHFDLDATSFHAAPLEAADSEVSVRLRWPEGTQMTAAIAGAGDDVFDFTANLGDAPLVRIQEEAGGALVTFAAGRAELADGAVALSLSFTLAAPAGVIEAKESDDGRDPLLTPRSYGICRDGKDGGAIGVVPEVAPSNDIELSVAFDFTP